MPYRSLVSWSCDFGEVFPVLVLLVRWSRDFFLHLVDLGCKRAGAGWCSGSPGLITLEVQELNLQPASRGASSFIVCFLLGSKSRCSSFLSIFLVAGLALSVPVGLEHAKEPVAGLLRCRGCAGQARRRQLGDRGRGAVELREESRAWAHRQRWCSSWWTETCSRVCYSKTQHGAGAVGSF